MAIAQTFQQIWSHELTAASSPLVIDSTFGLTTLSIVLTAGAGTFTGTLTSGGTPSSAITLVIGESITVSGGGGFLLDGITITTTGTVSILGR